MSVAAPAGRVGSGMRWPAMIVGLLAANVSLCALTVHFALRDRPARVVVSAGLGVEEGPQQRAMNEALGWGVRCEVEARGDGRVLVVTASDGSGRAIRAAKVHAEVGLEGGGVRTMRLSAGGVEGRYEAELAPTDPVRGRVRVVVEAIGMRYSHAGELGGSSNGGG